ncbi:MAG: hypothetical protein JW846_10655 [Dehalococcoidia bacterium]|nr:hypothetical protein [Dehalococcoidia bacterium]
MFDKRQRIHEQVGGSSLPKTDGGTAGGLSGRACRKMVLCLDTNYLSNLAKAHGDRHLPDEFAGLWRELRSVLEEAVWSDRLVCPGFNIQIEEAEFDDRLALPVWTMMRALSLGVQFLSHDDIVARQVEDAAYRFLGQEPPPRLPWENVFQHDPDVPAVELSRRARARPFVPPFHSPDEIARRRVERTVNPGAAMNGTDSPSGRDARSLMDSEQRALVARWFSREVIRDLIESVRADRPPQDLARWNTSLQHVDLIGRLRQAGMNVGRMAEFVRSSELRDIPYSDIYCSIVAAAALNSGDVRMPRSGDESDRRIVSALLPFSDILCTDRFVRHVLVDLLHHDVKYGCRVFSGHAEDVRTLVQDIRALSGTSCTESGR